MYDIRKTKFRKRIPDSEIASLDTYIDEEQSCNLLDIIGNGYDIEDEAISNIDISRFVKSLNGREKIIVNLFMEGFSQDEIADHIGVSQATVSRVKTALKNRYYEGKY